MSLNRALIGREYHSPESFEIGREHIRRFAEALGDPHPAYLDQDAAVALGHPDVIAPPTFLTVLTHRFGDYGPLADRELGLDYTRVVHGDQRFEHRRPVRAGDALRTVTVIEDIRTAGSNEFLTERSTVLDEDDEIVAIITTTIVSRGSAAPVGPST